jgi:hypothetical protein
MAIAHAYTQSIYLIQPLVSFVITATIFSTGVWAHTMLKINERKGEDYENPSTGQSLAKHRR